MRERTCNSSSVAAVILTWLICFWASIAAAQDIFYFLRGDTVELYNRQGVFQKSYPLPVYANAWKSGLTTDGVKVWVSYLAEREQIDQIPFASAPVLDGAIATEQNPGGFVADVAIDGTTLYATRYLNDEAVYSRVESYNVTTGDFSDFFGTGYRSFPSAITVTDNSLFVVTNGGVSNYSKSGNFRSQFIADLFPGQDPSGICTDGEYLYLFWMDNVGYAYEFDGDRVPSEDITFEGLASYNGVDLAWGPDGPNIMTPDTSLEFSSVVTGETITLDLTIQNVGNSQLDVSAVELSDTTNFSSTIPSTFSLAAGTSQTFGVSFTPSVIGDQNATLSFTSNDMYEAVYNISLAGRGASGRFFVDCNRSTSGSGASWGSAFDSINSAMASVEVLNNSEIWVREGICDPATVSKQVEIYGGFSGSETTREQRDWQNNETIIDGNSSNTAVNADVEGVLDGFIIQNGYSSSGGGIMIYGPGFILANSIVRNNTASNGGGGVYAGAAGISIIDSSIIGNTAPNGAGLFIYDGSGDSTTIDRCRIAGNVSTGLGGAMYVDSSLILTNSLIHDNTTNGIQSGSIVLSRPNNQIINNTIVNNRSSNGQSTYGLNLTSGAALTLIANNIIWANGYMEYDSPIGYNDNGIQIANLHNVTGETVVYNTIQELNYGDPESGEPDANNNMRLLHGLADIDGPDDNPATWADNDYRLLAGSNCIDSGDGDLATELDIYSNPRYDDRSIINRGTGTPSHVDIGCHERQSDTPMQFYVDAGATGAGTGQSWTDAFTTIHEATDQVADGAEIWVKSGTYLLDNPIELRGAAGLYGGFMGAETVRYARDWIANPTVIDGQHLVDHCIAVYDDAIVDGFTVTRGGLLYPSYPLIEEKSGGGIYVENASPIIAHNIITENIVTDKGGGIYIYNGPSSVIDSCFITDNTATRTDIYTYLAMGGGIGLWESAGTEIINSVIAGNFSIYDGGGIASYSSLSIINSTFADNRSSFKPGLAAKGGGEVFTITNSIFRGNIDIYGGSSQIDYYTAPNITYSNVQGGATGFGNIDQLPMFVVTNPWDDNGTPTNYADDTWTSGDYHLQWGSPSIDSGTDVGAPAVDLDQIMRPQSAGIDMGAYEIIPPTLGDINKDDLVDLRDAILSLQVLADKSPADTVSKEGDVNGDQKIGIEEVIYILNN